MDTLTEMMAVQCSSQEARGYDFSNMTERERGAYITSMATHATDELMEMLHEVPFYKEWKKYSAIPDENMYMWQKARVEFADVIHFILNIALALGMSADEVYYMYMEKQKVNQQRLADTTNYKRDCD